MKIWAPPEMSFFRNSGVSAVLESSCIAYTLRFCARGFLALTKKILFSKVPIYRLLCGLTIGLVLSACNQVTTRDSVSPSYRSNDIAEANLNLGVAYLRQGEYEKALNKLKKAQTADPKYPPIYNALGLLYQQVGELEQAEDYYKQAISLEPTNSSTLNNYGLFLCSNNRFDEAEETFHKATSNPLYETPEISISNAGTCALKDNRPDDAENYFRQALSKNPKIAPALIQMGELSYDQGKYLPARGYLQRYLEITKPTAKSLWLGIRIEEELGDKNVLSSYALLLRNNYPDSEEARMLKESGVK